MKRTFCFAAVVSFLFLSCLSHAVIDFSLSSSAPGLVTIGYNDTSGTGGIRGLALIVDLSNSATAVFSDIVSINPEWNTFIDYAYTVGSDYQIGDGHPFAYPNEAGALETPASRFVICMGQLDPSGGQALASPVMPNVITFRIQDGGSGFSYVTIAGDTLRSPNGVVGDNIGQVSYPQPLRVVTPEPATMLLLSIGGLWLRKRK